jgi:hypothetical protein
LSLRLLVLVRVLLVLLELLVMLRLCLIGRWVLRLRLAQQVGSDILALALSDPRHLGSILRAHHLLSELHRLKRVLQLLRIRFGPAIIFDLLRRAPYAISDRADRVVLPRTALLCEVTAQILALLEGEQGGTALEALAYARRRAIALGERLVALEIGTAGRRELEGREGGCG